MVSGHFCFICYGLLFQNGLREEQGEPLMQTYRQSYRCICVCEYLGLNAQTELSFRSAVLHPINLPDIWHEAAQCWGKKWWGWGMSNRMGFLDSSLWVIIQHEHTERKALFEFVHPCCFLSLCPCLSLHPSLSSSTWHACGVSTQEVEEKKQLCSAVINPQDVIHKLFTINSLSV